MAGGVLGAAGFLQPWQGERQALSKDGVQDGEEGSGALPTSHSPSRQGSQCGEIRGCLGAGESSPCPGSGSCCVLPRGEKEEATVQQRLRKNLGLCLGVAEGPWGGA